MLTCRACGVRFLYTPAEQRLRAAQGIADAPTRCPGCAALARLVVRRQGVVKWYDRRRGYGFIRQQDGADLFVHRSELPDQGRTLRQGQAVEFEVEQGAEGERAAKVALAAEEAIG